jgi:hypothetical protein
MKKGSVNRNLLFLFIGVVLLISIFAAVSSASFVSAATNAPDAVLCSSLPNTNFWAPWKERCNIWLNGPTSENIYIVGQLAKWIILFLIILLIYYGLSAIEFPPSAALRVFIAILVGFLSTFLITSNELLTLMQGYTAMGVAIAVFLPFIIMGGITVMTAKSLSPIGIYLQKVLWVVFSFYLLVKTVTLWAVMDNLAALTAAGNQVTGISQTSILGFFNVTVTPQMITMAQHSDRGMLLTLILASIVSVFIMLSNKIVIRWFAKEEMESLTQAERNKLEKSRIYDSLRAQEVEKGGKGI